MNLQELKSDINFLCGSTSATYLNSDKVRNMNIAYQDVARLIWESAAGWQFDDSNATTLPLAKTTLVHNQQDYSLPATTQRVEEVMVKDSGGNWVKLKQFDIHDTTLALPEFMESTGLPQYYDMIGRSVMLYPTPSSAYCTLASGLGVYISRDVTEFGVSATSTVPGFATPFHRILSYAAAMDFSQDPQQKQMLAAQKDRLEKGLTRFYSKREVEGKASVNPAGKPRWRQYL